MRFITLLKPARPALDPCLRASFGATHSDLALWSTAALRSAADSCQGRDSNVRTLGLSMLQHNFGRCILEELSFSGKATGAS